MSFKVKYYHNQEGVVYTEDHVLVKNLFLMIFGEELEQQELQKHFEKYGCVKQLHLFSSENKIIRTNDDDFANGARTGYVVYEDPLHAANALKKKLHHIKECRIRVQPSYSWYQPDAEKIPSRPENMEPAEEAALLNPTDECLGDEFKELSISNRVRFARTSFRHRDIYEKMSPMLDISIEFELFFQMTASELRDFFKLSGRNVKQIEGRISDQNCDIVCNFVKKYCINLESMTIWDTRFTSYNMLKIFANLNRLQNLKLIRCYLRNDDLKAIEHLNELKELDISFNGMLTAKSLLYLPRSIESLTLKNYESMSDPEMLHSIFLRLPLLKELHIPDFILKSPSFEQFISDNCCESLETLSIGCDNNEIADYYHIARIPNLKKLIMKVIPPILMTWLVKFKSQQLEHFDILSFTEYKDDTNAEILAEIGELSALRTLSLPAGNVITDDELESLHNLQNLTEINLKDNRGITDNGVLRLILACPKLRVLNLEYCWTLTEQLLYDIISNLQDNQDHRQLPIKLFMFGTKVNKLTLLNEDLADTNIIDVVF